MIKTIKASKSEKVLFVFLIVLAFSVFLSFFLLKNKCLFVENNDLEKLNFKNLDNIAGCKSMLGQQDSLVESSHHSMIFRQP